MLVAIALRALSTIKFRIPVLIKVQEDAIRCLQKSQVAFNTNWLSPIYSQLINILPSALREIRFLIVIL